MKNPTFWLLLLFPLASYGLDQLVRMARLSLAADFILFPNLALMAFSSLVFVAIAAAISRYTWRREIGLPGLILLLLAGLYAWLYPLLPPQAAFASVSYLFNSYTSLSGVLLILLAAGKLLPALRAGSDPA